jgi:hypothetical protein
MPMHCERERRALATDGPAWTMTEWPFMPEDVRQRMEADKDRPKAPERLYGADGRLKVAPGSPLPDGWEDLLTEDQVLGGDTSKRRKVRRR